MLTFNEALQIVLSSEIPMETEKLTLKSSLKRILAEDILSDIDMPPFDKSAMDGFACRKEDIHNDLEVIGEIPAGSVSVLKIQENQCARIMTGAMVPEGADFVIMKEHVTNIGSGKIHCLKDVSRANICYRGEDVKSGDVVLNKGCKLMPAHIALLASVGHIHPIVYKMPSVAIISTGNELVEPDEYPGTSKIRNSNSCQMASQSLLLGLSPDYLGIIKDDENSLKMALTGAIEKYQVVLISGGVSVGDYDFVPKILRELGVEILFHGIKAKPGKHLLFGRYDNHFVFGMPGNPVSSFVQFEVMVKPLLYKIMGNSVHAPFFYSPLEEGIVRKKTDELNFTPVIFTANGTVQPVEYHGSAHIHSFTKAQGIMEIPLGIAELKKGEIVCVRPI
jgi:molybdopterin molybdotransferase